MGWVDHLGRSQRRTGIGPTIERVERRLRDLGEASLVPKTDAAVSARELNPSNVALGKV